MRTDHSPNFGLFSPNWLQQFNGLFGVKCSHILNLQIMHVQYNYSILFLYPFFFLICPFFSQFWLPILRYLVQLPMILFRIHHIRPPPPTLRVNLMIWRGTLLLHAPSSPSRACGSEANGALLHAATLPAESRPPSIGEASQLCFSDVSRPNLALARPGPRCANLTNCCLR